MSDFAARLAMAQSINEQKHRWQITKRHSLWDAMATADQKCEDMARMRPWFSQLAETELKEAEHNLRNKVTRGKFTAAFFLHA